MLKKLIVLVVLSFAGILPASQHGMYVLAGKNIRQDIDSVGAKLLENVESNNFKVLNYYELATPDIVREKDEDKCKFRVKEIVFTSDDYIKMLTSYGNKYLVAAFFRIAVYENPEGVQIVLADPETINRIIFNDLAEDDEAKYNEVINKTVSFKNDILSTIYGCKFGEKLNVMMEPIRDDDDLAEASKDMFMMVGPLTFFTDEDQFPQIFSTDASKNSVSGLVKTLKENMKHFSPTQDDIEYRYTKSKDVLKWKIIGEVESPDKNAVLLGISRPRTEGLSFHIAGSSRESDENLCPGIDHAAAYPIEVLIIKENGKINIYTPREMFRMDMYFWDAGMSAFMNHMSMPGILDEAIKLALLGNMYKPE